MGGEQPGSPGADSDDPLADGASGEQQASSDGDRQTSGASTGAPADGQKSDDEILAEALDALRRDSRAAGEAGNGDAAVAAASEAGNGLPTAAQSGSGSGGSAAGPPLTDAEKARRLNQELERQFAEFDELMRREREASQQASVGEGRGGGSTAAGGSGLDGEGGEPGTAMSETAMANRPPPRSSGGSSGVPGSGDTDIPVEIPADIGNTRDDDIIARQLREAAMKEQDPVLREKLWDEYRKYKSGGS